VGSHYSILSAIGADRPGLVDEVTRHVLAWGGNVEDSRMVNLHGQFAIMMLVAGSPELRSCLQGSAETLEAASGLHVEVRDADFAPAGATPALPYRLTTWAMDHPGLMQSVTHLLGELGINIERADSTLRPAPYTNTPLFEMELTISLPAATHVAEVREALGRLCDDLNIDWQLTAL